MTFFVHAPCKTRNQDWPCDLYLNHQNQSKMSIMMTSLKSFTWNLGSTSSNELTWWWDVNTVNESICAAIIVFEIILTRFWNRMTLPLSFLLLGLLHHYCHTNYQSCSSYLWSFDWSEQDKQEINLDVSRTVKRSCG